MSRLKLRPRYLLALGVLVALGGASGAAGGLVFSSTGPITVNECCGNTGAFTGAPSTASPYPSIITVPGSVSGTVSLLRATVTLSYNFPQDLDILLVSPSNARAVRLMSDVGGSSNTFVPDTLTFQDAASLIGESPSPELTTGTYKPTNSGPDCDNQTEGDAFPSPAPAPNGTTLADFIGQTAAGDWKLYVIADCNGIGPDVTIDSWSVDITTGPTAVRVTSFNARVAKRGAVVTWRTAQEQNVLGFNVYRSKARKSVKLNHRLVRARGAGSLAATSYRLLDRSARTGKTYLYRLQVVTLDGKRTWQGSVRLRLRRN